MRVLYLSHRLPYAPNRGDRIRAYHTLRHLRELGHDVHLLSLAHDASEAAEAGTMGDLVSSVEVVRLPKRANYVRGLLALGGQRTLTHVLLGSPALGEAIARAVRRASPDVVFAYCSGMAQWALQPPLANLPFVLDMVDVDSEKWRAMAATTRTPLRWIYRREARLLASFETLAVSRARHTLVVNERERQALVQLAPAARISVMPNGVDLDYFRAPDDVRRQAGVVFAGVFDYAPNAAGAEWLLHSVWPRVRAAHPTATLTFAGSGPSAALRRAASTQAGVAVTGAVADLRPYLWRATVAAAPLFVARGLQNKVVEALAAGLRVVTTSQVAQGLPDRLAMGCRIADDVEAFAAALIAALDDTATNIDRQALEPYTWTRSLAGLESLLSQAAAVTASTGNNVT
jgi:sugar transferase (PEP-CTERM/EpsH1 system associated)